MVGVILLLELLVSGCSSAKPVFMPQAPRNAENAMVYVYWPPQTWREQSGSRPELQVDGVPIGILRYKSYLKVELASGAHEFRITGSSDTANWQAGEKSFDLSVEAGEVHYVRLLVKFDQSANRLGKRGMEYVVQFLPRTEREARVEMGELRAASGS